MSNTIEQYEMLAKLFANENIGFMIDPELPTAAFDIKSRTLYLPFWEFDHKPLYHFIIGHEVGHALFTPFDPVWEDPKIKSIVNIVEDYRIDIKMKHKLPGLVSDYQKGIEWLLNKQFLGSPEEIAHNLTTVDYTTFLNRLVLYLKVKANDKNYCDIPFTTQEKRFISKIVCATTFQDVVDVSRQIQEYLKKEEEENQNTKQQKQAKKLAGSDVMQDGENDPDSQSSGENESEGTQDQQSGSTSKNEDDDNSIFKSTFQDSLNKNMESILNDASNKKINFTQRSNCTIVDLKEIYTPAFLKSVFNEFE